MVRVVASGFGLVCEACEIACPGGMTKRTMRQMAKSMLESATALFSQIAMYPFEEIACLRRVRSRDSSAKQTDS
jgi:hypothetical protein